MLARIGAWLFAVTIAGAALAVGTIHTITLCIVTGAMGVAAVLTWWGAEPMHVRSAATMLLFCALGLTAYTALQAVPMPAAWVAAIAPHNADVWARALSPLRESGPQWVTVSVDPVATRVEVLKGVFYLLAFVTGVRIARRRGGVAFVGAVLMVSSLLVAVAAVGHVTLHEEKLFGFYAPMDPVSPRHIAPIMNPNSLAGYVNVGLCIAMALALDKDLGATRRSLGILAALLLGSAQLWIASRGGVAAMVLGVLVVVAMARARRGKMRATPVVAGLMVAAGCAMAVLAQSDEAWVELADADVSKLSFFRESSRLVALYPVFGAGRGGFESAFPEVRTSIGFWDFAKPENVVLEWATEWGLPVAIAAFAVVLRALRPSVVLARTHGAIGAWAALVALAAHNLVDFSSEIAGVAVAMVCCAAVAAGGVSSSREQTRWQRWALKPRAVAIASAVFAVAAIAWSTGSIGHDLISDRAALGKLALDPQVTAQSFRADVRAAILRHPGEPYMPYAGALRAARAQDGSVVPWVQRTLERAPVYGGAHALLARELFRVSPAQARMEYRIAIEQFQLRHLTYAFAQEAVPLVRSYDDATEVVPQGPEAPFVLEAIAAGVRDRLPATRERLDETILSSAPRATPPLERRARDWLADLQAGPAAPWCEVDRESCLKDAIDAASRLQQAAPSACTGYALEGWMREAQGDKARAVDAIANHLGDLADRPECLGEMARLAIAAGDEVHATFAIDSLARSSCEATSQCVGYLLSAAQIESSRGNDRRALVFYRRAFELAPERDDILSNVAATAMRVGLYVEAIDAYQKLAQRHPSDALYAQAAARAREALVRTGAGLQDLPR